jgi:hypothetical protein
MPKLALGAGIAQGAQSFVNGFMQARQYENQQKMMKHQIIIQALQQQLQDDNIPYSQRARILDSIPGLLGVKMDTPLSQQMGLHDLLDEEVETQNEIPSTPEVKGTPASTVTDPKATEAGLADTIGQEATQDVPAGIGRDKVAVKFGDLSPTKYKQLLVNHQQDVDSERALEQYRRKAEIDLKLQDDTLKAQGYTQVLSKGIDTNTGQYSIVRANANGDVKLATMPKGFVPLEVMVAQTKGSMSQLPASVRAYKAYFESQKNPITGENYTEDEAQTKALEYYKQNGDVMFGLTKAQKEATTQGTVLSNTGQKPRTQAEVEADKDRDENRADRQATQLDTQYGILRDSDTQLTSVNTNLSSAEAAHNQAQSALDAWIMQNGTKEGDEGYLSGIFGKADHSKDTKFKVNGTTYYVDPSDLTNDEFKTLNTEASRTRSEVNKWRAEEARIRGNKESAQQRIRNLEARQGAKSGTSNAGSITITQAQIDTFRTKNANKKLNGVLVRDMQDRDIQQLLMQNRNKWQP